MASDEAAGRARIGRMAAVGARALAGLLLGALAGASLTLAIVVLRARLQSVYLHSVTALAGWEGIPLVLLPLLGLWVGIRGGPRFRGVLVGAVPGLLLGIASGTAVGDLTGVSSSAWAGGIIGAAAGLLLGSGIGVWRGAIAAVAVVFLVHCGGRPPSDLPEPGTVAGPDTARVREVVFFFGDAGQARIETSPVLARLRSEVEAWAPALPDSSVAVVVLGDDVYPAGMHEPGTAAFAEDSVAVASQAAVVAGPAARRHHVSGIFVAGNHDWGQEEAGPGVRRVENLGAFLDAYRRATGIDVDLLPPAGKGGPEVVDMGSRLRLALLDTAWWLLVPDTAAKGQVVDGISRALEGADGRRVVIAAHHPFASGGPHGGLAAFGRTLGIRTLLARSGAMLQDLESVPYRDFRRRLQAVFRRRGAPALFVGGHEHSLQVIRGQGPGAPTVSVVAGSASKLTPVGPTGGTVFARSAPGFARLFVLDDGTLRLSVAAAPASFQSCGGGAAGEIRACMREGVRAFRTVWAGPV